MLGVGWAILIGFLSFGLMIVFTALIFHRIDENEETQIFKKFKYTTNIRNKNIICFEGMVLLGCFFLFYFLYTFNFSFIKSQIIEIKEQTFFDTYASNNIYEILFGGFDNQIDRDFGNFCLALKDKNGSKIEKTLSVYTSIIYEDIDEPILRETTTGKKNFLYHYYKNKYEIVFPLRYKEK